MSEPPESTPLTDKSSKPRPPLSKFQQELLDAIAEFRATEGISPSLLELASRLESKRSTVGENVQRLIEKGYLKRDSSRRRTLELTEPTKGPGKATAQRARDLPLLGTFAVGEPIARQPDVVELIPIPESLIRDKRQAFLLRVRDNSMVGAGLLDGDLVVVNPDQDCDDGDIVAAIVGGDASVVETTIQRYLTTNTKRGFQLRAENSEPKNRRYRHIHIIGVVSGSIRAL